MKAFLATFLSLILLISNFGLTMGTHFCGGMAVKSQLMIGHNHLDCGMPGMDMATEKESDEEGELHLKSLGCCENHYQTLETDHDFKANQFSSFLNIYTIIAVVHSFLNNGLLLETEKPQYANYSPPLILRDIPVLNQVFII